MNPTTLRLSAWYGAAVGAIALYPFLALHLTRQGLSDAGAAATLTLLPLGTLLAGPAWAWWVDHSGSSTRTLTAALALSTLGVGSLMLPLPAAGIVGVIALFAIVRAPIFPLADALTVQRLGARYGMVRAIGSLVYVGVVLASGWQRASFPLWPIAIPFMLLAIATMLAPTLPDMAPVPLARHRNLSSLWRNRPIRSLLAVAFLNGFSLTTYDHLFTLHMERIGVADWLAGAAIAWGVLVEVAVLLAGPVLLARLGSGRLLVVACAAGIPRFLLTAWLVDPLAIGFVQGLHGLQFGAFWLAAVDRMAGLAPPNLKRSAQALLPATGFGLATLAGLITSASWLSFATTRTLFLAMSAPAVLATLAALHMHISHSPEIGTRQPLRE